MKLSVRALWIAVALFCSSVVRAQIGPWQASIKRTDGVKETGTAFFTYNADGTCDGYSLTTLTFGVATYTGTWSVDNGVMITYLSADLNGQQFYLSLNGKPTGGRTLARSGTVTYVIQARPGVTPLDLSGSWTGSVKQGGATVGESFISTASAFPGIGNFEGLIFAGSGNLPVTGQACVDSQGKVTGYSVTEINGGTTAAYFTGKYKAATGTLTIKGVDEFGNKLRGTFHH